MGGKSKIKKPKKNIGKKINETSSEVKPLDYPVFCFRHLHKNYSHSHLEDKDQVQLVDQLHKLSQLSWNDIVASGRHGLGSEKIAKSSIKPGIPEAITDDVEFFLALRFSGMKAMVGWRNSYRFHIVYLDRDYSVYSH